MQRNAFDFKKAGIRKILVAEDVQINQDLARHILESHGFEVAIANNGYEALQLLEREPFDFVLMDVQMPEMDGIETTLRIRQLTDPVKSSIPIIALTANVLSEDIKKYRAAGMNDYLAKPFDESGLLLVISRNRGEDPVNITPAGKKQKSNSAKTSAQPLSPTGKLYDLSMVQSIAGGDAAFIKKMVLLFIDTVPQNVQELISSMHQENWVQVGKMAHKLKSTVDSMGIRSIHDDIRTIETNAKQQTALHEIPALVNKIDTVIGLCVEQLRSEIG